MTASYGARAAVHALRLIEPLGTHIDDLQLSFVNTSTLGQFPKAALEETLEVLHAVRLVETRAGVVRHTARGAAALGIEAELAAGAIDLDLHAIARGRANIVSGAAGEEAVVNACQTQLERIGRSDLAVGVARVSLISDALGYDVVAPRCDGGNRLLEVKTATDPPVGVFPFFISRNEVETGRAQRLWSLVACRRDVELTTILGWTVAESIKPYLPDDAAGRWTEAFVRIPTTLLVPGLPPAL